MQHVRIGLVIGTDSEYARRVLRGISRFAREAGLPWLFWPTPHGRPDYRALARWGPDAVIAHLIDAPMADRVKSLNRPAINVAFLLDGSGVPHVGNDDAAIGRAAADHLLARHFRRFAFVGRPGVRFSDLREAGFSGAIGSAGHPCVAYRDESLARGRPQAGDRRDQGRLLRWLASLATPVGVMACNDVRAWQVLEACRELGKHVPDEFAVVGADDDPAWCLLANPPLSSVAVDAEQVGYLAADRLARLLDHEPVEPMTAIPPRGVVTRSSSDTTAIEDPMVAQAVRYILDHADRPIRVADLLEAVPTSRRALERAFRRAIGHSPADEVRRAHLRRASGLLAETELSMGEVARRSGFASAKQLSIVFRREIGSTPTEHRAKYRPPPVDPRRRGPTIIGPEILE